VPVLAPDLAPLVLPEEASGGLELRLPLLPRLPEEASGGLELWLPLLPCFVHLEVLLLLQLGGLYHIDGRRRL